MKTTTTGAAVTTKRPPLRVQIRASIIRAERGCSLDTAEAIAWREDTRRLLIKRGLLAK
jgi:hypothetical protein